MEQHGRFMEINFGKLDLNLESVIVSVILEIAKGELMYGRDMCKNPERYTWNKTYYYYYYYNRRILTWLDCSNKTAIKLQILTRSSKLYKNHTSNASFCPTISREEEMKKNFEARKSESERWAAMMLQQQGISRAKPWSTLSLHLPRLINKSRSRGFIPTAFHRTRVYTLDARVSPSFLHPFSFSMRYPRASPHDSSRDVLLLLLSAPPHRIFVVVVVVVPLSRLLRWSRLHRCALFRMLYLLQILHDFGFLLFLFFLIHSFRKTPLI